ncbi:hypothetical protein H6F86_25685 [Phormidium sp. FACHB-592]|uniref:Uncharacterized protein n=1 Tax=Stenomitos frigidus AS-A4 TaxID=2933935 RepID=A0ABV0KSC3_9CYAN|nr:hypothetical protein [Phormidium sp. FACHB-592]MBD2077211.1 hypothetical protein [Phormidium sp. FACHB-592]
MNNKETETNLLLPKETFVQLLQKLHAIADELEPTTAVETLCHSDSALQHPRLMQYVCGTEHLNLAIGYLSRAFGIEDTAPTEQDPEAAG